MENFVDFPAELSLRALSEWEWEWERERYAAEIADLAADCRARDEVEIATHLDGVVAYMSVAGG